MARRDDEFDELKEEIKGFAKWKAELEKTQAIENGIKRGVHIRCMAVVGIIWSGIYWLGSVAVENSKIVYTMIEAAIRASNR